MKKFYMLAVLLIVAALLAACGGGSASNQGAGSSSGTSAGTSGGGSTGGANTGQTGGTATTGGTGGGGGASATAGDPKAGETLFNSATIGSNPGCKTCHSVDGSKLVGPSLQGIASRAGTRVQGQSAEEYIRTSITDPNAYTVPDFPQGVMPSFKTVLSDTQLNDLVAYLMTLK